jgi:propionyl-CoA carboxylase beta chain
MMKTLEELETRRDMARNGGGAARIEAQHAKGKLTARERLDVLLDEGSSPTAPRNLAWRSKSLQAMAL